MQRLSFETERYLRSQRAQFQRAFHAFPGSTPLIEFGGKPFDDKHAARVLPGYEADTKAEVLKSLMPVSKLVMVINAMDVCHPPEGRYLQGRVRGDSGQLYKEEVIRLILRARELGVRVDKAIVSVTPIELRDSENQSKLDTVQNGLAAIGVPSTRFMAIPGYPNISDDVFPRYLDTFEQNGAISGLPEEGVTVLSPGGGSGKFGVLLSEAYHLLKSRRHLPNYIKFETFPVFDLDFQHALNLAFLAATADLGNKTISLGHNHTTYDKDVENFALLKWLFAKMGYAEEISHMQDPTHMGINRIVDGITDMNAVIEACREEIARRIARYTREIQNGFEKPATLDYAKQIAAIFDAKYCTSRTFMVA